MRVWRINLRPKAGMAGTDASRFCLKRGLLGVGWHVGELKSVGDARHPVDEDAVWQEYEGRAASRWGAGGPGRGRRKGWQTALKNLREIMEVDDLVWTRDSGGVYHLGRVTGRWRYEPSDAFRDVDIANVRDCTWARIGTEVAVPGKIPSSFSRGGTLQPIKGAAVREATKLAWNNTVGGKGGEPTFGPEVPLDGNEADGGHALLSMLSPEATEDLVGVYLQEVRGYRVVPSTAKRSTQAYEFALRGGGPKGPHVAGRARYGERAVVQVKSGAVAPSPVDYAYLLAEGNTDRVFLFSSRGGYSGSPVEGIECLSPGDLTAFAYRYDELLPNEIAHWIDVLERLGWSFASSNRQDPTR